MGILSIDHVQLTMPADGPASARAFYGDVFQMEEMKRPPGELTKQNTVWFRSGSVELHLAAEEDFRAARKGHPALVTNDLDDLARRCEQAGFPVKWDQRYPGMRRFYVFDPFGNRLEIMQPEETEK